LAKGKLSAAITIEVAGASKAAIDAVEAAGGKVVMSGRAAAEAPEKKPKRAARREAPPA